jgi:hypothetical protein
VIQRISLVMRLCVLGNQFANESVLHEISFLLGLCGVGNKFADAYVHHRISSLMSVCFNESVPSRVCASVNQFPDKVVWCMEIIP